MKRLLKVFAALAALVLVLTGGMFYYLKTQARRAAEFCAHYNVGGPIDGIAEAARAEGFRVSRLEARAPDQETHLTVATPGMFGICWIDYRGNQIVKLGVHYRD